MDEREFRVLARSLLDALGCKGWTLVIDKRPTRRLGECRYDKHEIGVSLKFIVVNEWAVLEQTVRHEAAHALVGPGYGHGLVWQLKARELGVKDPASVSRSAALVMPALPVKVVCPEHGVIDTRPRVPKRPWLHVHRGCRKNVTFEVSHGDTD